MLYRELLAYNMIACKHDDADTMQDSSMIHSQLNNVATHVSIHCCDRVRCDRALYYGRGLKYTGP
jgi:hypothetical protein